MKRFLRFVLVVGVLAMQPLMAQSVPSPWSSVDIGHVGAAGRATGTSTAMTVHGAGADIWGTADAFHFAYQRVSGDAAIVARVASLQQTHDWTKAGVMIRESLTPGSRHAFMLVSAARGVRFQRRLHTGGETLSTGSDLVGPLGVPQWVRLARTGDLFTAQISADGAAWRTVATERIQMGSAIYLGLPVTSHDVRVTAAANFDGVAVTTGHAAGVTLARQPFLQQVTASSAIVVWTTFQPLAGEVRYTRSGGTTLTAAATSTFYPASRTGLAYDYYQHEARLFSLAPATTYDYEVRVGGARAFDGGDRFRTAPANGSGSARFIAFGDSGTGSAEQRELAALMERETFDLALHTGDLVYGSSRGTGDGTFGLLNDWFFLVYERWLRRAPMFPSLGNHDSRSGTQHGVHYLESFVLPENGASGRYPDHAERYYSFDYGPVHFVALDTELAFQDPARRAEQLAWLDATLASTSQPWKVAYFHRTPYSAGPHHGSDLAVRAAFVPLFEKHGVQLVLAAHEHVYERTRPLPQGRPPQEQVVYVVTGGGGAPVYPTGEAAWTAFTASSHHYVRAHATVCTLDLAAIGLKGSAFDTVRLDRCGGAGDAPTPTLPAGWTARDVGTVGRAGSGHESGGTFTLTGSGADIWDRADGFHFVSRTLSGDGEIVARVRSLQAGHHWAKAGVMMRESLTAGSSHALMLVSAARGQAFQRRVSPGGLSTHTDAGQGTAPAWIRLVRTGATVIAYRSDNGANWTEVARDRVTLGSSIQVGLALTSHDNAALATATFDSVRVVAYGSTSPAWRSADVGSVGQAGSAQEQNGVFTLHGAGADIWGSADGFHFLYRSLSGDGEIVARVASLQAGHHWGKAGVMIRETLGAGSRHAFMLVSPGRGLAYQRRASTGGTSTHTDGGSGTAPVWVRLVRSGQVFEAFRSVDGRTWTLVKRDSVTMGASVHVGLAVTSHDMSALARAVFDDVQVIGAP